MSGKTLLRSILGVVVCLQFLPGRTNVKACVGTCANSGTIKGVNQGCTTILYPQMCQSGQACQDWHCYTAGCYDGNVMSCKPVSQACDPQYTSSPSRNWECAL